MSAPAKPQPLRPQWQAIPQALREVRAWVAWRYEWRDDKSGAGKWTKPPRRAVGDGYAKANDPTTWADFEAAQRAAARADGVGLVLTADLVGVDLDHVLGADGVIEPWAADVIERFRGCYVERSPGGDGLRIFCRGVAHHSGKGGPENRCEVYDKASPRYLTVTGHRLGEGEVIEAQAALNWLHERHFEKAAPAEKRPTTTEGPGGPLTDDEVIRRAREARNGAKFARLWAGDAGEDASSADAALVAILAFWTQDAAQLDRLFRRSGLMRPKWDEKRGATTYGERTIAAVLEKGGERFGAAGAEQPRGAAWPDLDPLPALKSLQPAAFPFDGLGPILGPAARAIAEGVQAPDAMAAGSVLAAASLAAQPHADVLMPHGDTAPLSMFIVTSASSGDRKSATDKAASEPVETRRRADATRYAHAMAQWREDQRGGNRGDPEDDAPAATALVVSKGTTEGLHHLLRQQSHLGLFSPEGAELLAGHSMREDRRAAGIAWMLKAWGGETLDALTRKDGLSVLFGRRLALHVLVQPVILRDLLADPLAQGQGLVARCLVAQPATLAGTRRFREGLPAREHPAVLAFHDALRRLLARPLPVDEDGDGLALQPRILGMSAEARALWIAFYDEAEREQAEGGALVGVRAWASKAAEHAARLAGVLTLAADPDAREITGATMRGALTVADFYLGEHVRLLGQSQQQQRLERLHGLLQWMRERGASTKHADILQFTPRPLRDLKAEGLGSLLAELAQRGYIRRAGDRWEARPDA